MAKESWLFITDISVITEITVIFGDSQQNDLLVAFSLGAGSITWLEIFKLIRRRTHLQRITSAKRPLNLKRVAAITFGWVFLLAGFAGLFLPVLQGILLLLIGLVILSHEYRWAGTLLARIRSRFTGVDLWLRAAQSKAMGILGTGKIRRMP